VGDCQGTERRGTSARGRRPRLRSCFRKGCDRKYQPQRYNQRYCQDRQCQQEVRRWHAAKRQARHREDDEVRVRHAQAEKARRQRAKSASQAVENPKIAPARGHAAENFFSLRFCDRPGCYQCPVTALCSPGRYCSAACRQAVRNVLDRERKWFSRNTSGGRDRRAIEYEAARRRRLLQQGYVPKPPPPRLPAV
jgi:hypothetical protein